MKYKNIPDQNGYFGDFGGCFVSETLMPAIEELKETFVKMRKDKKFQNELKSYLKNYVGRPTPLYFAEKLSKKFQFKLYLKREDLCHTGAHKINNALAQVLLAKKMGKTRVIAETGAGQHGVATATAASLLGLKCRVYMGTEDMRRQSLNVFRMQLLGTEVVGIDSGSKTLKDAINEAFRDWVTHVKDTHYVLGTAFGAHPYPYMVREFMSVIGTEAYKQIKKAEKRLPDAVIACVGGGSNAIGIFSSFIKDKKVRLIGVEAGGKGIESGLHAARFAGGRVGVFQGTKSYLLQDENGQALTTHSVSAGLDYASVGPEHSFLREIKRASYSYATDEEALNGFSTLAKEEGIIPALESSHAVGYLISHAEEFKNQLIILNLSGRGDKDVIQVKEIMENMQ